MRHDRSIPVRLSIVLALAAIAAAQQCVLTPLTPFQPAPTVEEGEIATQSRTFRTTAFGLSPSGAPHVFDTVNRIRRIENGRIFTLAGNGTRADAVTPGPALDNGLPSVTKILFPPDGTPHFIAGSRVFRIVNRQIEPVAGSGRPGFNGESAPALELNLNSVVDAAFDSSGRLLLIDGFNRVRRLDPDGTLRTVAGSRRASVAAGLVGDEGSATAAALNNPRQVVPLKDGSFWIRDLSGRHIRIVTPDGIIDTINRSFVATVNIVLLPDGTPAAAASNLLFPLRPDANIDSGSRPFPPFTGTPLAVDDQGALYFLGSARQDEANPLIRFDSRQNIVAAAPASRIIDGQAAPFGVWRSGALLYASTFEGKAGIFEARPGQAPRFAVGGGGDIGDADGKSATSLTLFGITAFTVDGSGRIIVADVYRRRILLIEPGGQTSVLKTQDGSPVIYAPLGAFSSLQRIAADDAGNIYWYSRGATPTGGVFAADISVFRRATGTVTQFPVVGLAALVRREDGSVAVIAGNSANFRSAYPVTPDGIGQPEAEYRMLPITSIARFGGKTYFIAATRIFRGAPGSIELINEPDLTPGSTATPDFLIGTPNGLLVHRNDGGFYRLEDINSCATLPQPALDPEGVRNAASLDSLNLIAPRQLLTIAARGFGPAEGQGFVLDGSGRAAGQSAPYPALLLGNFSGANPLATLSGTTLPLVSANDRQVTVQAPITAPAGNQFLLYFSWQGLQLIHPATIRVTAAAPGLYSVDGSGAGQAVARNEDGEPNSASHPAPAGSIVDLFGTGFGTVPGSVALGDFFPESDQPDIARSVSAQIGGRDAEVISASGAPGAFSGIYRIRLRVPEELARGEHAVTVSVADSSASNRVTIRIGE